MESVNILGSKACSIKYCLPTCTHRALRAVGPRSSQEQLMKGQLRQARLSLSRRHLAMSRCALVVPHGNILLGPGRPARTAACEVEFFGFAPRLRSRQRSGRPRRLLAHHVLDSSARRGAHMTRYELRRRGGSACHPKRTGHASSSKVKAKKKVN